MQLITAAGIKPAPCIHANILVYEFISNLKRNLCFQLRNICCCYILQYLHYLKLLLQHLAAVSSPTTTTSASDNLLCLCISFSLTHFLFTLFFLVLLSQHHAQQEQLLLSFWLLEFTFSTVTSNYCFTCTFICLFVLL